MTHALTPWILQVMVALEPTAPWRSTYETTAEALATVAEEEPLFPGKDGPRRTAALFVSVAWYEAHFQQDAKGDCRKKDDKGRCVAQPQSLCMFQVGRSNLGALGTTEEAILSDINVCTRSARKMMYDSFGVCRGRPTEDMLGHYASGGQTCGGLRESRHRVAKAKWLESKFPFVASDEPRY